MSDDLGENKCHGMATIAVACCWFVYTLLIIQGISTRPFPGLVNFVPAVAYLFCLNLPAAFLQPANSLVELPCVNSLRD